MTPASRIQRAPLHDQIVTLLRDQIVAGTLPPGEKLNERELCEAFGVSRTPLREALKVLTTEGLVRIAPNYGASVTELTIEDLEEVFPVIGSLEALSGELAARQIDDAGIARIADLHDRMVGHYERRELAQYFECNEAIHEAILSAAGNPTLTATMRSLAARIRRARYVANLSEARWKAAVEEHEEIMRSIRARDPDALADILRRHLENKLASIRAVLTER
jgi:DNA-binding GntR family transcriptional regulator